MLIAEANSSTRRGWQAPFPLAELPIKKHGQTLHGHEADEECAAGKATHQACSLGRVAETSLAGSD